MYNLKEAYANVILKCIGVSRIIGNFKEIYIMKKAFDTVTEATEDLQSRGFTVDFHLVENGIGSKSLKKDWNAGELEVVEFYRFEGATNPSDNMILYAIECKDGQKGTLLDAYGADTFISREMIKKLNMNDNS